MQPPDGPQLGQLITDGELQRDAVHIAVAPVTAAVELRPGQHVGLIRRYGALTLAGPDAARLIGIVDPLLPEVVRPGQRFWLWLYPGSITRLRHIWSHPEFTAAAYALSSTGGPP